jgi:hypothetical protein
LWINQEETNVQNLRESVPLALSLLMLPVIMNAPAVNAQGGRDRVPPTTPTNLTVTAKTPYSVTLAWNPSTDKSGQFSYVICCANTSSETASQTETSHVYTAGLEAGRTFSLRIIAVDAAGNYSKPSNTVTFTLPTDTIPPTKPIVSVVDVGPTYVSLAWSSTDDGPHVWYAVSMNGAIVSQGGRATAGTFYFLQQETPYTFRVQARDFGGNLSPISEPINVTTEAANPNDHTPPTTPTNLREEHFDEEIHVSWDPSTDDFDPQSIIRYDVYVNGVLSDLTVGLQTNNRIVYGQRGSNAVSVFATDTANNRSNSATIIVNIP